MNNKEHITYLLQGAVDSERPMKEHYARLDNQPSFLCTVWAIALARKSADVFSMACELICVMFVVYPNHCRYWLLTLSYRIAKYQRFGRFYSCFQHQE